MQRLLQESEYFNLKECELAGFTIEKSHNMLNYYYGDAKVAEYDGELVIYAVPRSILELFIKTYKIDDYSYDFSCADLTEDVNDLIRAFTLIDHGEKHRHLVSKYVTREGLTIGNRSFSYTFWSGNVDIEKAKNHSIIKLCANCDITEDEIIELAKHVKLIISFKTNKIYTNGEVYEGVNDQRYYMAKTLRSI